MEADRREKPNVPEISLVVPVHNESAGIRETLAQAEAVLRENVESYEMIVVDDGSTDQTWELLEELAAADVCVGLVRFTRNFGKEAAILAGLERSRGAAVIVMDGDLQHPPQLIPTLVALWKDQGYQVVHAVKERRQAEPVLQRAGAAVFYGLMKTLSGYDLRGGTDYKLLDRRVVQVYLSLPERLRFFRALIPWLGFRNASVPFLPPARGGGHSRWGPAALLRLGVRAICAFSAIPMQVVTALGALMFAGALIVGAHTLYMKISDQAVEGFSTVILLLLFVGSILMVSLGIIGQYAAMIYEEVKRRPSFLIERTRNLPAMSQNPPSHEETEANAK